MTTLRPELEADSKVTNWPVRETDGLVLTLDRDPWPAGLPPPQLGMIVAQRRRRPRRGEQTMALLPSHTSTRAHRAIRACYGGEPPSGANVMEAAAVLLHGRGRVGPLQ